MPELSLVNGSWPYPRSLRCKSTLFISKELPEPAYARYREAIFAREMLTFFNGKREPFCAGISRRNFLGVGALAMGGLALSDFLRLKAEGLISADRRGKSVIMICLGGGPSHVDMYDMKPNAPAEIRGE